MMNKAFLWCGFLSSLLLPISLKAAPASNAMLKEISIGFNPAENAEAVEMNGKAFADYYKQKTGVQVKTFIATDYTALIEALRSGRIHFAFLPPFSFVKAEKIADAVVLMKAVRRGQPHFFSTVIVRADKGFNKIEDLKGKNIAWVDPSSSSGHIFPKAALMAKKNIDPETFFGKQIFAGSHDALVLAVLNGTVDAGATFSNDAKGEDGSWNRYLKGDDVKKIKAIFVTDPIPADTMATSQKIMKEHQKSVDQLVKTMTEMGKTEEGKKIFKAMYQIDSMVVAKSSDFEPVRSAAKLLKVME